uniref:Putative ovule protein n=1 Tax=Solanum chacoense TaxID=4108 RepID=A0A0V0HRA5_SOLCH
MVLHFAMKKQFCSKKNKLEKSTQCSSNKVKSYALITKHCLGYSCITKLKWSIDLNIQLGCFISFFCLIFRTTISSISED